MRTRWLPDCRLVVRAPAKVNLFLEVLGKRADGYHELETLMVAVDLYDTLVFQEEASGAIEFRCDEAAIPQGPTNLVVRSALLIREETESWSRGVSIELRKRIPAAAGMGGGSSDAAATLTALNQLWQLGLSQADLCRLGARIGSDVPFFFHTPMAIGRGRGERLESLPLANPIHLVAVCPREGVSTAEVFSQLTLGTNRRPIEPLLEALNTGAESPVGSLLFNRLQTTATQLCPAIATALEALEDAGLAGPIVTGSGSASFALAASRRAAVQATRTIRERFPGRVFALASCPD